jgi:alcohol dehydrogenase (NADP+)
MSRAHGYAALNARAPVAPFAFDRREPREHDVDIAIRYCGICHSDIHQARDEWGGSIFPMVPGHEIVGTVTRAGSRVTRFKEGDTVGVGVLVDCCHACAQCRQGLEQYCTGGQVPTYNGREHDGTPTLGGYADHIVVHEDFVLRMPVNLPLAAAAPLLCAGVTLYSPLRHWNAGPGKEVAIVGLGGLGHIGVKLAHAMGANVTVLSHSHAKAADAQRLGADRFHATSDPRTFTELEGRFDLVVNTVSAEIDWSSYLNLVKVDGSMVLVGIPEKAVPVAALPLVFRRRSLAGSAIGSLKETQDMLDFCSRHDIACDIEMTPIQKVNECWQRVLASDVRYRFVIDMASLGAQ